MKAISVFKSVAWAIIIILSVSFGLICFSLLSGCSFQMSIESAKKPTVIEVVKPAPVAVKQKSNYQKLKEQYKEEWLNLPNPLPKDHQEQIKNQ
jgi:hypothetical protein